MFLIRFRFKIVESDVFIVFGVGFFETFFTFKKIYIMFVGIFWDV